MMKMHANWCEKSWDGLHCFHILIPKKKEMQPTREKCCWCGKEQGIYFITGSTLRPHGKSINKEELFFPIDNSWDSYHENKRRAIE